MFLWGWKIGISFLGWIGSISPQRSEKAMAPHSSTLAWKIPWMEEPSRLWSMGSLRVGHDWANSLSHTAEGNGSPLQCSCLENPRDGGAWWAAVYGITQSRTRLKRLSSSSSSEVMSKTWQSQCLWKLLLCSLTLYRLLLWKWGNNICVGRLGVRETKKEKKRKILWKL